LLGGFLLVLSLVFWWQSPWTEMPAWAERLAAPHVYLLERLRRNCAAVRFWLLYLGHRGFKAFNDRYLVFVVRMLQVHTFLLKINNEFFRVHILRDVNAPNDQLTDRRRKRALAANPASEKTGASKLKRLAAVRWSAWFDIPFK